MDLAGRNVVITGASQGIGERLAERFAEAGAHVLLAARSVDRLAAIAQRIGGTYIPVDLSDAAQVDGFIAACIDRLGSIDVLVNNAGVETENAFADVDRADVRHLVRLNLEAPMLLTHDVVAHMLERGGGHVVQMSSVAGAIPFPGLTAYAGSKAGLTHFTESLRLELRGTGVGLTVVSPGPVDTPMWGRLEDAPSHYPAPALRRFRRLLFLPKIDADVVARATVAAVIAGKRHVRLPARYNGFHYLNNAPRRLVQTTLLGVRLPRSPG